MRASGPSGPLVWYLIDKALHLIVLSQLTKMMHKMLRYIEDLTQILPCYSWADQEGEDRGSGPPPEKPQSYRVSKQYLPESPKNRKVTKPAFNVGPSSARQRNAI